MVRVEVDKILSLGEFKDNINKIIDEIENASSEDNFYVFTKEGGKPCAALMNIDYLKKILNQEKIPVRGRAKADAAKEKIKEQLDAELNSSEAPAKPETNPSPTNAPADASTDNNLSESLRLNRNNIYVNQNDPQPTQTPQQPKPNATGQTPTA